MGCRGLGHIQNIPPPGEQENNRIPHQPIATSFADFNALAQTEREKVAISFPYRGDLANQAIYLQVRTSENYQTVAVVSHPLLVSLTWPSISDTDDFRIFQKNGQFETIDEALHNLPSKAEVVADTVAATHFNLHPDQYTPLEDLITLNGVTLIFTSYTPSTKDGGWMDYYHTANLSAATVDGNNKIQGIIYLPNITKEHPLLLGTIQVDFNKKYRPEPKKD
jgi:hypothetical protein